jgi:ankyrin repeat protein
MHGADPGECDKARRTPLFLATVKKDLGMMSVLLEHEANPNSANGKIELLTYAFLKGHEEVASILLACSPIERKKP